jgi:hypothetical protein
MAVQADFVVPAAVTPGRAEEGSPAHWSGVFAMTLCVFALIASEFMPVSLLTPIASDLRISEGQAGQGIAISGAFAVLTSLSIWAFTGRIGRKTLLLLLTVSMCASGAVVGLAPNFVVYMAGRALLGVVIGGFWSLSAATAMRLVPAATSPRKASMTKILMSSEGRVVASATLDDNETARHFASLLPLRLVLKDYEATEKIADLPSALATSGAPAGYTPSAGDLSYYAPWGNLAIFHKGFEYSSGLIRLGRLDAGLEAMRHEGPLTVLLTRELPTSSLEAGGKP